MSDLLNLRYIPISQAELFDNNAKLHNINQIIQSIARYGFKTTCKWESTLNNGRGGIVAGNGRVEALREMERRGDDLPIGIAQDETGEWCVPVLFGVEAESEAIARAYALDDNNLTLLGGDFALADLMKLYNPELLMSELEELARSGEIPVSVGETNLEELLSQLGQSGGDEPKPEYGEDDPTVPEGIQVREGVELGSIWALGRHRIMCADSTVETNVRELLGDRFGEVGMVWADAPYGIDFDSTKNRTKPFGSASLLGKKPIQSISRPRVIGDSSILTAVAAFHICDKMINQFWWGANHYASELPPSSCWIVWDKENSGDFADCELAWTNQNSAVRIFRHMWNGCVKASEHGEKRVHPTQKPIELFVWCAKKYGQPKDIVFDPFLGSGISVIGCEKMQDDRTVYGMELSLEYTEIILQRWEKFANIPAKRIN